MGKLTSNKFSLDEIAKLLRCGTLEEYDDFFIENNYCQCEEEKQNQGKCDCGFEDERGRMAQTYIGAIENIAGDLLKEHGLKLVKSNSEYRIVALESWEDASDKIRMTINGVGYFHFNTVKEFMQSGPYTARESVLQHLGWIKDYWDVYGYSKHHGQNRLEKAMRY